MATASGIEGHIVASGQHYSARNRVPNIQEFMNQLDREKAARDEEIEETLKDNAAHGETNDHENNEDTNHRKDARWVRDPVTGGDVQIRDAHLDFEEAADNPKVNLFSFKLATTLLAR